MDQKQWKKLLHENTIVTEGFSSVEFNSHKKHNPAADILEGHFDNYFITYGIYVKDTSYAKKGDEFMEYYKGENYGYSGKSYSRMWKAENIIPRYKKDWLALKDLYNKKYKGK